jgi:ribosomal protein L37E
VSPVASPSWSRFFEEFHCRGCGFQEAYRSRPRGFFEKHVLPFLLLQTVRCERCYHRSYALCTIPVLERVQPDRRQSQSQPPDDSMSDGRVA